MEAWIKNLFAYPSMTEMGHGQSLDDLNLGFGWIYYGLARMLRPKSIVVIGSYRGFVPMVFGKAVRDNGLGEVHFIDPSLVDDFWKEPQAVRSHFEQFDATSVRHYLATTQEFVRSDDFAGIQDVGILFVDGYHTAEQARYDHRAFIPKMQADGIALFHDSARERLTRIYGEDQAYVHTVCRYMDELRAESRFDVFGMPMFDGLTLVRSRCGEA